MRALIGKLRGVFHGTGLVVSKRLMVKSGRYKAESNDFEFSTYSEVIIMHCDALEYNI